jgi:hypothetical protein
LGEHGTGLLRYIADVARGESLVDRIRRVALPEVDTVGAGPGERWTGRRRRSKRGPWAGRDLRPRLFCGQGGL